MTKQDKLLNRFRQNPRNVRFEEMDALLTKWGFTKRIKGSHATFTYGDYRITIPYRKPFLLPVYVKHVLAILDDLSSLEMDE